MIALGHLYRWPDGKIVKLVGVSYTGKLQLNYYREPEDRYSVGVGDIYPSDLEILIKYDLVKPLGPAPDEEE